MRAWRTYGWGEGVMLESWFDSTLEQDPGLFFRVVPGVLLFCLVVLAVRAWRSRRRTDWVVFVVILLLALPTAVVSDGMGRMRMDHPARVEHHVALVAACLGDADSRPDRSYCERMAGLQTGGVPSFVQEILASSVLHLADHSYAEVDPLQELLARKEAERLAATHGADGSTRFTGEHEEAVSREVFDYMCDREGPYYANMETTMREVVWMGGGCDLSFEDHYARSNPRFRGARDAESTGDRTGVIE